MFTSRFLPLGLCVCTLAAALAAPQSAPAQSQQVRKNIANFSAQELASLRRGVAVMQSRSSSDPTSWAFQAAIHGTPGQSNNPLFNQCEHGTRHFLAWHRAYLHHFERILRKASGDDNLTLPYWDWSNQRSVPLAMRPQMVNGQPNPLFSPRNLNNGALLPLQVVQGDLEQARNRLNYTGFTQQLDGSPHGAVHVIVGGQMQAVPTSANDPLFWLHHANVDRHWDAWLNLGNGRINPTDNNFLNRQFTFVDENGANVQKQVRDWISSKALGYRYDNVPNPPSVLAEGAPEAAEGEAVAERYKTVASSEQPGNEAAPGITPLGLEDSMAQLNLSQGGLESLGTVAEAVQPRQVEKIRLVIQGIRMDEAPQYTYGVYLNLAAKDQSYERSSLHYVGSIDFFSRTAKHGHAAENDAEPQVFDQTLDATATIARLKEADLWNPEKLTITLRPLTPVAVSDEQEKQIAEELKASAEKAGVGYKRVVLQVAE